MSAAQPAPSTNLGLERLGELIGDDSAASATVSALGGAASLHARALHSLADQAIRRGIDYAALGLNWDHPQSRIAYRKASGTSFSKPASRDRQSRSRMAITSLMASLAALPTSAPGNQHAVETLLVKEFCAQIGAPDMVANATFEGVVASPEQRHEVQKQSLVAPA